MKKDIKKITTEINIVINDVIDILTVHTVYWETNGVTNNAISNVIYDATGDAIYDFLYNI